MRWMYGSPYGGGASISLGIGWTSQVGIGVCMEAGLPLVIDVGWTRHTRIDILGLVRPIM